MPSAGGGALDILLDATLGAAVCDGAAVADSALQESVSCLLPLWHSPTFGIWRASATENGAAVRRTNADSKIKTFICKLLVWTSLDICKHKVQYEGVCVSWCQAAERLTRQTNWQTGWLIVSASVPRLVERLSCQQPAMQSQSAPCLCFAVPARAQRRAKLHTNNSHIHNDLCMFAMHTKTIRLARLRIWASQSA